MDGDALDAAISAYLQARTPPPVEPQAESGPVRRVIAVDGKVVRGSRSATAATIQLLPAVDHHGVVLAQRQVASKSNEIASVAPLLGGLGLENTVVAADALHTQHDHGAHLISRGAHYVAVVKKNHPGLYAQVGKLPWRDIPLGHRTRDRTRNHAHQRDEIRRLKVTAFSHLDHPGARQAIQVVRWPRDLSTGKLTIEHVYLITSLSVFDTPASRSPPGSEATGASRTSCTTSGTARSVRTRPPGSSTTAGLSEATDPTRFTAELGPLPVGLERAHLQTPIRLNDFLHPAEDDVGDDEDRAASLAPSNTATGPAAARRHRLYRRTSPSGSSDAKRPGSTRIRASSAVAGTGFEPATSGL
ncbi:ISAs1 family transposase [Streptomyces sp. NPDC050516]|uniref:ISAs1 family transposase n=1 Tax=Streptomyces sp. NPDC050516 TaxID=3365621 RepID=UPI0037A50B97